MINIANKYGVVMNGLAEREKVLAISFDIKATCDIFLLKLKEALVKFNIPMDLIEIVLELLKIIRFSNPVSKTLFQLEVSNRGHGSLLSPKLFNLYSVFLKNLERDNCILLGYTDDFVAIRKMNFMQGEVGFVLGGLSLSRRESLLAIMWLFVLEIAGVETYFRNRYRGKLLFHV